MQVLLAISILCFLALIWVAISIARYVNESHRRNASGSHGTEMPSIMPRASHAEPRETTDFSQALAIALARHESASPKPLQQPRQEPASEPAEELILHPTRSQPAFQPASFEARPLPIESKPELAPEPQPHSLPKFQLNSGPSIFQAIAAATAPLSPAAPTAPTTRLHPAPQPESRLPRPVSALEIASEHLDRKSSASPAAEDDTTYYANIATRISQLQQRAAELQQNVHDISSSKGWNMPPKPLRPRTIDEPGSVRITPELLRAERAASQQALASPVAATPAAPSPAAAPAITRSTLEAGTESQRKPPQPLRHGVAERLDRAYANQDAGDLTDPYQIPRAGTNPGLPTTKRARS